MITLFNPTNEHLTKMVHGGIEYNLKPDEVKDFEDAVAKHLLTHFEQRGLCQLRYGTNKEEIAKQGKERNLQFKKAQVSNYNVVNEQRKMSGLGYLRASDIVRQYALELGIELLEPYTLKDQEKGEISRILGENEELKKQMALLLETMNKLSASGTIQPTPNTLPDGRRGPGRPPKET